MMYLDNCIWSTGLCIYTCSQNRSRDLDRARTVIGMGLADSSGLFWSRCTGRINRHHNTSLTASERGLADPVASWSPYALAYAYSCQLTCVVVFYPGTDHTLMSGANKIPNVHEFTLVLIYAFYLLCYFWRPGVTRRLPMMKPAVRPLTQPAIGFL